MHRVGFKLTITALGRAKTFRALDRTATVMGYVHMKYYQNFTSNVSHLSSMPVHK
jgi:hypothetical protein